ncbi:MAG: RES family NAD+ phosphorylase [Rhizobiaceae bacterium]|nr:RES family NAD+ phosphorylase [Rhizobiaceae bacterium]
MRTSRPLANYVRVMPSVHVGTPLGFGYGTSRFSPRLIPSRPQMPFGLIYGALDLSTACYEAIIRDSVDLTPGRILRKGDYDTRSAVNFSTRSGQSLDLLDLTGGNAVRYGVPTDVIRYSHHQAGQHFSEFVYSEMPDIDGLLYTSRFTETLCVAVYDRAIAKLTSPGAALKLNKAILAPVLAPWNVQVL